MQITPTQSVECPKCAHPSDDARLTMHRDERIFSQCGTSYKFSEELEKLQKKKQIKREKEQSNKNLKELGMFPPPEDLTLTYRQSGFSISIPRSRPQTIKLVRFVMFAIVGGIALLTFFPPRFSMEAALTFYTVLYVSGLAFYLLVYWPVKGRLVIKTDGIRGKANSEAGLVSSTTDFDWQDATSIYEGLNCHDYANQRNAIDIYYIAIDGKNIDAYFGGSLSRETRTYLIRLLQRLHPKHELSQPGDVDWDFTDIKEDKIDKTDKIVV
ncbi:hypothetical protein RYZ26_12795 [Terasakiella sp. A23]|uniref:hypothetical protein n=1 Tax=Terasakiella sp. FCG-A23 TaxID=3080561 RepID=UPI00295335BB|nr:hypothetical protein [Terasakiella sp. A23]MDV7340476.1 hypothetical protein [Terasakiella sp. A23]